MKLKLSFHLSLTALILSFLLTVDCQIVYNTSLYTLGPDLLVDLPFNGANYSSSPTQNDTTSWVCHDHCEPISPYWTCVANYMDCNVS